MRVKTSKFRNKKVNKKRMTDAEIERANAKHQKFTMLDRWFDRSEPAEEALEKHMSKRFNRYDRRDVFYR